ncbi:MAG: hypothetical protein PHV28_07310 [Kiritimatiellae bacterium]|nr:hypothetical protein [Kiritimatiellia bacterium]
MRTAENNTFCLIPESDSEHKQWEAVLAPYCWADGEFGMFLTEAAFREMGDRRTRDASIPQVVRNRLAKLAKVVEVGDYADVCLQHAAASGGSESGKRR